MAVILCSVYLASKASLRLACLRLRAAGCGRLVSQSHLAKGEEPTVVGEVLCASPQLAGPLSEADWTDTACEVAHQMLRHILLLQRDVPRAAKFYSEGLGLKIKVLTERWAELHCGSSILALKAVEGYDPRHFSLKTVAKTRGS